MAQSPFSQWQQPLADPRPPAWAPCPALSALSAPTDYIVTSSSLCSSGSVGLSTADGSQWLPCPGYQQPQPAQQDGRQASADLSAAHSCSGNMISQRLPSWEMDPSTAPAAYGGYWEPDRRSSLESYTQGAFSTAHNITHPAATAYARQLPTAGQPGGSMAAPMQQQHPSMFCWAPGPCAPNTHQNHHQQQRQQAVQYPAAAAETSASSMRQQYSSYHAAPYVDASSSNSSSSSSSSRTSCASPLTLLCCTPPALPVGLASEVHLHLSGAIPSAAAPAGGQILPTGAGVTPPMQWGGAYSLQLTCGPAVMLEAHGWCSAVHPVISVSVPPLPAGTFHLHLSFPSSNSCAAGGSDGGRTITHTLLVLPGAAAAELSSYWSELLVAAAGNANGDIIRGSCGYQAASCMPGRPTAAAAAAAAAAAGPWAPNALAAPGVWSMEVLVDGQLQQLTVQPSAVQCAWRQQYMPLAQDVLYLMPPGSTPGPGNMLTGQQQYGCSGQPAEVSLAAREVLAGLVERLAGKGMWALLQLLTDQVFGDGSSAKALFSANMVAAATAAGGVAAPAAQVPLLGAAPPGASAADTAAPLASAGAATAAHGMQGSALDAVNAMRPAAVASQLLALTASSHPQQPHALPPADAPALQGALGSNSTTNSSSSSSSSGSQSVASGSHPDASPAAADLAAALPQTALTRRGPSTASPHHTHTTTTTSSSSPGSSSCATDGAGASGSHSTPSSSRQSRLISSADVAARTGSLEMPEWFEQGLLRSLTSSSSGGSEGPMLGLDWLDCDGNTAGPGKQTPAAAATETPGAAEADTGGAASGGCQGSNADPESVCASDAGLSSSSAAAAAGASPPGQAGQRHMGTLSQDPAGAMDSSSCCAFTHSPGCGSTGRDQVSAFLTNSSSAAGGRGQPPWLFRVLLMVLGLLDVAVAVALVAWLLGVLWPV